MSLNRLLDKAKIYDNGSSSHSRNDETCMHWNINDIYQGDIKSIQSYAVLILNRIISQSPDFVIGFWNNASVRITVDGGTVKWDSFLNNIPTTDEQNMIKPPDLVTGDFDSITPEILAKYKTKGCKIIHTPDQSHTDFTKALMELNSHCEQNNIKLDYVVAIAQSSGRLDQSLGNIQTLFLVKEKQIFSNATKVYMLCDNSVAWLLNPGCHIIDIPKDILEQRKPLCSLIPIGEVCEQVTTSGLKWNLDNSELRFGGIVSTSNTFDGNDQVKIQCSQTLLWTVKVPIEINS